MRKHQMENKKNNVPDPGQLLAQILIFIQHFICTRICLCMKINSMGNIMYS